MKHLILITGYPGAGKTTAVKEVLKQSRLVNVLTAGDAYQHTDVFNNFRLISQVCSTWLLGNNEFVAVGCHRKEDVKNQGADALTGTNGSKALDFILQHNPQHHFLYDHFLISPTFVKRLLSAGHRVTYIWITCARDIAETRRDIRSGIGGRAKAKPAAQLGHFYDKSWGNHQAILTLSHHWLRVIETTNPTATIMTALERPE